MLIAECGFKICFERNDELLDYIDNFILLVNFSLIKASM
jgi:hypothetical protein